MLILEEAVVAGQVFAIWSQVSHQRELETNRGRWENKALGLSALQSFQVAFQYTPEGTANTCANTCTPVTVASTYIPSSYKAGTIQMPINC